MTFDNIFPNIRSGFNHSRAFEQSFLFPDKNDTTFTRRNLYIHLPKKVDPFPVVSPNLIVKRCKFIQALRQGICRWFLLINTDSLTRVNNAFKRVGYIIVAKRGNIFKRQFSRKDILIRKV